MRKAQLTGWLQKALLLVLLVAGVVFARLSVADQAPSFPQAPIVFQHADGSRVTLSAEWAISPAQHAYGLMNRKNLAPNAAMIFLFAPPQPVSFWMKNTYIPLDMIFVSAQKRIVEIKEMARPLDETPVTSSGDVSFVVEVNGGRARELGLKVGDTLLLPYKNN